MITTWLVGQVALAGIDIGATTYPTLSAAVAAAVDGDTLVFDGATYSENVLIDGMALTFVGSGSTISSPTAPELVRLLNGASLVASDLTFESTVARGIDADAGSTVDLTQVVFRTAVANGNGAGIRAVDPASIMLLNVTFDHTSAGRTSGSNGEGGALRVSSTTGSVVTLVDVTFDGTSAAVRGGGIYTSGAAVTCDGCVFAGTSAVSEGGAIYATGSGSLTVLDSTFTLTTAGDGGAIRASSPLTVVGSTFCASSSNDGGAIYSTAGGGTLRNNVFVDSTGADGGAAHLSTGAWSLEFNTALTTTAPEVFRLNTTTTSARNNLFAYNSGTALLRSSGTLTHTYNGYFSNSANVTGGTGATDVLADPLLAGFLDDGICGNDQLWPGFGSPLIDAGDPALVDLDGGRSDIGAFGGPDGLDPTLYVDGDADGFGFLLDCDDAAADVYPGLTDVCDGVDNDCTGTADDDAAQFPTWFEDCDLDGQGELATAATTCDPPATGCDWLAYDPAYPEYAGDCDDSDPAIFLGAPEFCTVTDEDCDGLSGLDELGVVDGSTYYVDEDLDGYGDPLRAVSACQGFAGVAATPDDCDDGDANVNPSAADTCGNSVDEDCSGVDGTPAEERSWWSDADGDGFGDETELPVASCESTLPGRVQNGDDCNDTTNTVAPGVTEVCDGVDQDCDDLVDNTGAASVTYYRDVDGDGFGDPQTAQDSSCGQPVGFVDEAGDCDDDVDEVNPDASEACNGRDDDCDNDVDVDDADVIDAVEGWKDIDGDGYGTCSDPDCDPRRLCALGEQPDGTVYVGNPDDCDDAALDINPGQTEIPDNTVDEDCKDGAESPPDGVVPREDPGCNCNQQPTPPTPLAAGLLLLLLRRRRR
jgi:MYXO-CTERM domain-containing protein